METILVISVLALIALVGYLAWQMQSLKKGDGEDDTTKLLFQHQSVYDRYVLLLCEGIRRKAPDKENPHYHAKYDASHRVSPFT